MKKRTDIHCINVLQVAAQTGTIINQFLVTDSKDLPKADHFFSYMYGLNGNGVTYENALAHLTASPIDSTSGSSTGSAEERPEPNQN